MKQFLSLSLALCLLSSVYAADVCTYEAKGEIITESAAPGCLNKTANANAEYVVSKPECGLLINLNTGVNNYCTDLTKFDRVEFDVLAPSGSSVFVALPTYEQQNDKACGGSETTTIYSGYPLKLRDLITDQNTYQHVVVKLASMDVTQDQKVNFDRVVGLSFGGFKEPIHKFKNFVFRGGCKAVSPSPSPSSIAPSPSPVLKGEWEFCTSNSECANKCCSKEYSGDGKFKCTPYGSQCTGIKTTTTKTITSLVSPAASPIPMNLGEWQFCSSSKQCLNKCCSKEYSGDGKYKCTTGSSRCI
ncbi:hypothetical protein HK098_002947 [Nowakowskiella sp. JEL0407]|nr:hypothetical protein HK098_002947 [Nowakowskiella sp. JEL0407]